MSTALLEEDMTETPAAPARLLSAGPAAPGQEPAWEQFTKIPWPTRTDEHWRFANVKDLDLGAYTLPQPIDDATREDLLARSRGIESSAGRMVFANDQLLSREAYSEQLNQLGVVWLPLEQALVEHPDLVQQYFMREEAILGGQKFAALHASQVRTGMLLYVPRGVEIDLPIEAFHWLHGDNGSCFPHTLIIAEERAKVTVVDYYESADGNAPGLACAVNDLWLGAGASVTYVCAQNWSRKALAFQINATVVGRDAHARTLFAQLGTRHLRSESVSHLRGPGGRSDMLALTVADEAQEIDARTFQIHEAPHTASDLLYKNSLDDSARTIFSGLIRVDPGAHQTDAYQKVRNLLLSDEAEANSAPGLEIEANDVRCTHGATSGQIEQEELFYLMSRGISKRAAQKLIVHGFLQEVVERLDQPAIGAKLAQWVQAKFAARP
ncbi:MAG: Fe-S cluster assembly protein SufD [Chthoniobacter sp.]|uniref:Fe-S cluster assembly protein SufD n=1 Tax=Chthoniobacter sp. TaxID=2510640 RepID=UPI0032AB9C5A